jgi:hypothetical protein
LNVTSTAFCPSPVATAADFTPAYSYSGGSVMLSPLTATHCESDPSAHVSDNANSIRPGARWAVSSLPPPVEQALSANKTGTSK